MDQLCSIIVPFHKDLASLDACLAALASLEGTELIIASDAAAEDCEAVGVRYGARVIRLSRRSGPAAARNSAATAAIGDVLVFVDSDVVVSPPSLARMMNLLAERPEVAAFFGAYDDRPTDEGFISQYKNLAHAFVHRTSRGEAKTFWAGFGAIRRPAFNAVGGFDTRFKRSSVEDIDLGYRLTESGFRIMLEPSMSCTHLKQWTFRTATASDFFDRAIPWTQLIWKYGQFDEHLNVRADFRLSTVLAVAAAITLGLSFAVPRLLAIVPALLIAMTFVNARFYRFFTQRRGLWFATRVWLLRPVQDCLNAIAFATGTIAFWARRIADRRTRLVGEETQSDASSSLASLHDGEVAIYGSAERDVLI